MNIENFIQTYDNVLPERPLTNLLRYCDVVKFEKSKIINGGKDEENFDVRRTYIKDLSNRSPSMTETHWTNLILSCFNNAFSDYLKKFSPDSDVIVRDISILKYEINGLNNNYEGGNFGFKFGDKEKTMDVVSNRIVVWPSNFLYYHTVKPVTKGTRYSVVSWAL